MLSLVVVVVRVEEWVLAIVEKYMATCPVCSQMACSMLKQPPTGAIKSADVSSSMNSHAAQTRTRAMYASLAVVVSDVADSVQM